MNIVNNIDRVPDKKYYNTLLKVIAVGFFMSFFILITFQVTSAYFTKEEVTQKFLPIGNIQLLGSLIQNPFIYEQQITNIPVSVTNLSNTHIVLRAYLNVYWEQGFPLGDVSAILANNNWILGDDGFFYYISVLLPSGSENTVAQFLSGLEIVDEYNLRNNTNFIVTVLFEGAQFANGGYKNLWLTAPQEWLNIIEGE